MSELIEETLTQVVHDNDRERPTKRSKIEVEAAGIADDSSADEAASVDTEDVLDLLSYCQDTAKQDQATQTEPCKTLTSDMLRLDLKTLGPEDFLQKYILDLDYTPLEMLNSFDIRMPESMNHLDDSSLLAILGVFLRREYNKREKLPQVNTLEDVVSLLQSAKHIIVVTGAGISTSLGIPDFRSSDGIYSRLSKYQLSDPQELFDIHLFRQDPSIFYDFCKELLPEQLGYSTTHAFIRLLQDKNKLLRQYTQNIDNIESIAGIHQDKLIQCHGSFKSASCLSCGYQVPGESIFSEIRSSCIPKCPRCLAHKLETESKERLVSTRKQPSTRKRRNSFGGSESDSASDQTRLECEGIMKPDITFFGEQLPDRFKAQFLEDRENVDLVLCIGTSLRVAPVSEVPHLVEKSVPQIYINREASGKDYVFDLELLGDCDGVISQLAMGCLWTDELQSIASKGKTPK